MTLRQGRSFLIALVVCLGIASIASAQQCGPMDVVFVIDNSASMDPVINQVKTEVQKIADAVTTASGGDYRFGLVTMPSNNVVIALDMTDKNRADLATAVNGMNTVSSTGAGIAYDEALNAILNNLGPRKGSIGSQTGTFTAKLRPNATKIIMIITDTGPQGFDSTLGGHGDTALSLASQAAGADVRIAGIFVPDGGGTDQAIDEPILQNVAAISSGLFKETAPDASNLSDVIIDIVNECGLASGLIVSPLEITVSNGESADVKVTNFHPGDVSTLVYGSNGLPSDSSVTFTNIAKPSVANTNQQTMTVNIGPDTTAGVYVLNVSATHKGGGTVQQNFVLVNVDCTPPMMLGTSQPVGTTAGSAITAKPIGSFGLHYQWFRGHSGSTAFPVSGATSATFTPSQPGEYWVRVSNACGSVDSATAVVR